MILGIGGGTGSGKTTFAEALVDALGESNTLLLAQDCYYKDSSHLPHEERARFNFDHPDSVDFELLAEHLEALERNEPVHAFEIADEWIDVGHREQLRNARGERTWE